MWWEGKGRGGMGWEGKKREEKGRDRHLVVVSGAVPKLAKITDLIVLPEPAVPVTVCPLKITLSILQRMFKLSSIAITIGVRKDSLPLTS